MSIGNNKSEIKQVVDDIGDVVDENRSRIGDFPDLVDVPYAGARTNSLLAYARMGYYHVHGASFILPDENPVTVESSAVAWGLGAVVETIGVDKINHNFDLHWASISDISATLQGMLYLYTRKADADPWVFLAAACDVVRTTSQSREIQSPIMVAPIEAGTAIGIALKDDNAAVRSCKVKLYGHVYHPTL